MSQLIVCEEKHGTFYWPASTPEEWAESSLAILTERFNEGYWYYDPTTEEPSEWSSKFMAAYERALALTIEEIAALPEDAQKSIALTIKNGRRQADEDAEAHQFYEKAKAIVEAQDAGFTTIGKGRYERQVPKAWLLLEAHSDHEYEQVTLEKFSKARNHD